MSFNALVRLVRNTSEELLLPLVLIIFLIWGGASGEGFYAHAWLLLLCGMIIATAIIWRSPRTSYSGLTSPVIFLSIYVVLVLVQLLPLPDQLWNALPARSVIKEGWSLLSVSPAMFPLSMAPDRTVLALSYGLIPLAALIGVYRLGWNKASKYLAWGVAGMGAASSFWGLIQVLSPGTPQLYLYENTTSGLPVGFFSNANHQASFLLMTLPFTAALAGDTRSDWRDGDASTARALIVGLLGTAQIVGIFAVGSVAGYMITVPVLILCVLTLGSRRNAYKGQAAGFMLALVALSGMLVASSPVLEDLGITSFNDTPMSRIGINTVTASAVQDHFLVGTGLGTFEPVFKIYEDPSTVTLTFANHAHNDYFQWVLEMGLAGTLLLIGFLAWWLIQFFKVWRSTGDSTTRLRRAAASALVVPLLHSFVDYPLRTPIILALASVCVAMMIVQKRRPAQIQASETDTEPSGEPKRVVL